MKPWRWLNPSMFQRISARGERKVVGGDLAGSSWWCGRRWVYPGRSRWSTAIVKCEAASERREILEDVPLRWVSSVVKLEVRSGVVEAFDGLTLQRLDLS